VPRDGRLDYAEGLLMGYRGYDAAGSSPSYPFGHGIGYTSWEYESLLAAASLAAGEFTVNVGRSSRDLRLSATDRSG
jgi:beta-glucosidase